MAINSSYNDKSPNGIIGSANVGRKLYEEHLKNQKNIEIDFSVDGILKAKKELDSLKKTVEEVKKLSEETSGSRQRDLAAYAEKLNKNYEEEQEKIRRISEQFEERYNVSLEDEEKLLNFVNERKKVESEIDRRLASIAQKKAQIREDEELTTEEKHEQLRLLNAEEKSIGIQKKRLAGQPSSIAEGILSGLGENSPIRTLLDIDGRNAGYENAEGFLSDMFPDIDPLEEGVESIANTALKGVSSLVDVGATVKLISNGLNALRQSMTQSINQAAASIKGFYGTISANLEGSDLSYDKIADDVQEALGINRLVKQTDYLNQIADLTNQGLVTDLEQRALLATIKDKTLTSFDVANAGLTRLVRLGEQNSINQFGVELQLKRLLNSRLFGDSSYLSNMFDSVTSAILDSSVVTKGDITNFNSTVQTWLGAMYASGLSDNVINSIASGINALGSGNVTALANDESVQRLFLLSMDRIGMDYADILQQGLSSDDTHKLLSSVVELLNEIAGNTEDNLVLKSSYSNLFNLSLSDMQAIQNVYSKMSSINAISSSEAQSLTLDAVANRVSKNTSISEKWENLFDNFSYSFGSNIANSNFLYSTYRVNEILYDVLDTFSQVGGVLGKSLGVAKLVPAAAQYLIGGASLIGMFDSLGSLANDSLLGLLGPISSSGSSSYYSTTGTGSSNSAFKTLASNQLGSYTSKEAITAASADWTAGEEDEVLGLLKEMSKTLMKLKEGNGYAFAVSVEGMNNEVLRSFASIFADEDAMLSTFTGKNNVLDKALFDYFDDTTSNSTEAKDTSGNTVQA